VLRSEKEIQKQLFHAFDTAQCPRRFLDNIGQIGLTAINIQWNKEIQTAFKQLEEGNDNAIKYSNATQNHRLEDLILLIHDGHLDSLNR
jgi:hypothetical protein